MITVHLMCGGNSIFFTDTARYRDWFAEKFSNISYKQVLVFQFFACFPPWKTTLEKPLVQSNCEMYFTHASGTSLTTLRKWLRKICFLIIFTSSTLPFMETLVISLFLFSTPNKLRSVAKHGRDIEYFKTWNCTEFIPRMSSLRRKSFEQ